jgi:hypothetical protein
VQNYKNFLKLTESPYARVGLTSYFYQTAFAKNETAFGANETCFHFSETAFE